jgi:hypothetical protein
VRENLLDRFRIQNSFHTCWIVQTLRSTSLKPS